jgi:TRAP-type C4-dicarboxylate transport system permease small subunit
MGAGFCYDLAMDVFNAFLGKVETAIINPLITLIALAAFVVFIWGVVDFIRGAGNEEKRAIGQQHMLWGFIGLVIIFAAKAIIAISASTFGIAVPAV